MGESKIHENTSNLNLLDIIEKGEDHPDLMVPSKDSRSPVHPQIPISGQHSGSSLCDVGPSTKMRPIQRFRTNFFYHQPKYEKHLQVIPEDETPEILNRNCLPTSGVKSVSPNSKRVSPPHHGFGPSTTWRRGRKSTKKKNFLLRLVKEDTMLFMQAQQHLLKRRIWRNVIMKKLKVESRRCEWRGYRIC
ncbi:hypothetical protein NC653_012968 [Populus alba x Populus x berolinensis]|uniref:Uncharacterized protein n=1 Tax=Populus alba x Populus x berolinensis TaxID=444605 RepID=A0AAD6QT83_9ROSI|nr:hypothetical protein NC653_012968 [Populus alba x Populus x berolinensis]